MLPMVKLSANCSLNVVSLPSVEAIRENLGSGHGGDAWEHLVGQFLRSHIPKILLCPTKLGTKTFYRERGMSFPDHMRNS